MIDDTGDRVLILTSATGGGHTSAAAALAEGCRQASPFETDVRIVRVIEESHSLARWTAQLYNVLLRHYQPAVKYYYWAIEKCRINESDFLYRRTQPFMRRLFEDYRPTAVVSVHPMTQHFPARMLRELGWIGRVPLITAVTDPCRGFWHGWCCDDVSVYLVATTEAREQLIEYGADPNRIKVCGMPIHPKFNGTGAMDRAELRKRWHLAPDCFTVFVNAGWAGGGNIPRILKHMVRSRTPLSDLQAIFLAGRNERLFKQAEKLAEQAPFPIRVIGYTDEMEQLMYAADVMISKLGGLTTFEAFASGLPIIADVTTPPMPQEARTADLIERQGAGVLIHRAADIVSVLQRLAHNPGDLLPLRRAANALAVSNATQHCVAEIHDQLARHREAPHFDRSKTDLARR